MADDPAASQGEYGEAGTALKKIELLKKKAEDYKQEAEASKTLKEKYPLLQANPGRCNWHIEKDSVIIAKGVGAFSFHCMPKEYDCSNMEWREMRSYQSYTNEEKETARKYREGYAKDIEKFKDFINKLESVVSMKVGNGDGDTEYQKITVTEYKSENETRKINGFSGEPQSGMYFELLISFNYERYKGYVYKIEKSEGGYIHANKMNKKLDKVLYGNASQANRFFCSTVNLKKMIDNGSIAMVEIVAVDKPYQTEKWVEKHPPKTSDSNMDCQEPEIATDLKPEYEISEDTHTKTGDKIFVVKIRNRLTREDYQCVNALMQSKGGYYSKFKHGFIFTEDPSALLDSKQAEESTPITENRQTADGHGNDKLLEKVNSQLDTIEKKTKALSGDYKTNTYKRMMEAEERRRKLDLLEIDKNILEYVRQKLLYKTASSLEIALITGSFRMEIHGFYNVKYGRKPSEVKFPEVNTNLQKDGWYNIDVPKRQARLHKAGIHNSNELNEAVEEYKIIYDLSRQQDPSVIQARAIQQLEAKYKIQQSGDVYFTPASTAAQMVQLSGITADSVVLEPSAGIGNIADEIKKVTEHIDCCEWNYDYRKLLKLKGYNVVSDDFLSYTKTNTYDAIIMNPPFSKCQDTEHLRHAYNLLKVGGRLVCITSVHWSTAQDRKSVEFGKWIKDLTYEAIRLPSGTFEMTGVSSQIIVIDKEADSQQYTEQLQLAI